MTQEPDVLVHSTVKIALLVLRGLCVFAPIGCSSSPRNADRHAVADSVWAVETAVRFKEVHVGQTETRVTQFESDSAGFLVGLAPRSPAVVGGALLIRVKRDGSSEVKMIGR